MSTLVSALTLAMASVIAGCGDLSPPDEEVRAREEQGLKAARPGDRLPDRLPDNATALTANECNRFGGTISYMASCPKTTSATGTGGQLVGNFNCTINGRSLCIDESVAK